MKKLLGFSAAMALGAPALFAQDIEILAERRGRQLPPAYYERIRKEPKAFEMRAGWRRKLAAAEVTASAVTGTLPFVIIPVLFADSPPPGAVISRAALQSRLFDPSSPTTVAAFYRETSLGKLILDGQVTEWTPTSLTRAEVVGQSFGLGEESRTNEWLRMGVANVDASIDFGAFDNDGPDGMPNSGDDDGRVDGAGFLFREVDAACGGPGIWPHRWVLSGDGGGPAITSDRRPNGQPIVVDDYMVLGAVDCSGLQPLNANVFAHETGHVIGLPDYYDASSGILREQRRWVVGCWELMSAGSWGCGSGPQGVLNPTHFGPFPKLLMGWSTPRLVQAALKPQELTLRPSHSTGDMLQIPLSNKEYLLVEYRAKQGFDAGLPASGLLVYHVETQRSFLPCPTCPRTYSYALLEADGDSGLVKTELAGGNRGAGTDAYGPTRTLIDDSTIPSTRLNAGASTWVRLSKIVIDAALGVARVTLSLAPASISVSSIVAALGLTPLAAPDQALVDAAGNGNGRVDVGDFRAYLRFQSGSP